MSTEDETAAEDLNDKDQSRGGGGVFAVAGWVTLLTLVAVILFGRQTGTGFDKVFPGGWMRLAEMRPLLISLVLAFLVLAMGSSGIRKMGRAFTMGFATLAAILAVVSVAAGLPSVSAESTTPSGPGFDWSLVPAMIGAALGSLALLFGRRIISRPEAGRGVYVLTLLAALLLQANERFGWWEGFRPGPSANLVLVSGEEPPRSLPGAPVPNPAIAPELPVESGAVAAPELVPPGEGDEEIKRFEGSVLPFIKVTVSSPVQEIIESITIKEGDLVKKGQELALLRREEEGLELARLDQLMKKAEFDKNAAEKLFERRIGTKEDALGMEVELERLKVEKKLVELRFAEKSIVAPIDGVVVRLFKEPGESIDQIEKLLEVIRVDRVYLRFYVHEDSLIHFAPEQEIPVAFPSLGEGGHYRAAVDFVDPVIDAASGLCRIKLVMENPEGRIKAGMRAVALIERQGTLIKDPEKPGDPEGGAGQ